MRKLWVNIFHGPKIAKIIDLKFYTFLSCDFRKPEEWVYTTNCDFQVITEEHLETFREQSNILAEVELPFGRIRPIYKYNFRQNCAGVLNINLFKLKKIHDLQTFDGKSYYDSLILNSRIRKLEDSPETSLLLMTAFHKKDYELFDLLVKKYRIGPMSEYLDKCVITALIQNDLIMLQKLFLIGISATYWFYRAVEMRCSVKIIRALNEASCWIIADKGRAIYQAICVSDSNILEYLCASGFKIEITGEWNICDIIRKISPEIRGIFEKNYIANNRTEILELLL